jgi:hypothetical protein
MGFYTTANGTYSTAMGNNTKAIMIGSTSMGSYSNAKGWFSTAMGYYTIAKPYAALVIGQYNDTTSSNSSWWISTDPIFIIGNGTSSSTSNAMTVLKNGNTAIGHSAPTQMLDVNGNARFRAVGSGAFGYNLNIMSDGTLTTATSDISMKENIYQISNALDLVTKLRGVFFNWKNDSTKTKQIGMIAQEAEPIVPEIVFTNHVDGLKGINYSQASALFVEAIKEQQQIIEKQQAEIDHLKSLENEVSELKTLVNNLITNQTGQGNK